MKTQREQIHWARQAHVPTVAELEWLRSPAGRAACSAMAAGDAADSPAAISHWRERLPAELVAAAWLQVSLRLSAAAKFSRAGEMLFDRVALEQASDEAIAAHKAKRFAGVGRVVDFCCGIGGDAIALADQCAVTAVDWSRSRLRMAAHNAEVYRRRIEVREGDAALDRPEADAVHVDPDRRASGRRQHGADAASPNLETIALMVGRYGRAAIKLSPGTDFDTLPFEAEVELISHHGECKQAVLWTGEFKQVWRRATVLALRIADCGLRNEDPHPGPPPRAGEGMNETLQNRTGTITAGEGESLDWPEARGVKAGDWLYEPDGAVIRANLVGVLARAHDLAPVDSQIVYLVGEQWVDTPLMRGFRVIDQAEWSLKRARSWLAGHGVGSVDVKTRGFAARPEEIIRRLRLHEKKHCSQSSGTRAVLFLTRIGEKPIAILAERCPGGGVNPAH